MAKEAVEGNEYATCQVCVNRWWNKYHKRIMMEKNVAESNKRQKAVESLDFSCPEVTQHIERELFNIVVLVLYKY